MDGMKKKPGKPPETVRIEQDWEDAVGQAIQKPKPEEGWPKPEPTPQRSPKPKRGRPLRERQ